MWGLVRITPLKVFGNICSIAAEDIETGMPPFVEHPDHFFRDLALLQEHLEYLVAEDGLQLLNLQRRRDAEHAFVSIKASVCQKDVAVGIESEEVAECLHGDDRTGKGFLFRNGLLHKNLQGFPGAAAECGKKLSVIQKIPSQNLRKTEYKMPVGYFLEDIHA